MDNTPKPRPHRMAVACLLLVSLTSGLIPARDGNDKAVKTEPPSDLALVPGDAALLVRLEVGRYWNGREAQVLQKISKSHPLVLTWWTSELTKGASLQPDNIERLTAIIPDFQSITDAVAIVTTIKPFDRAKVLASLAPGAREEKVEDQVVLVSPGSNRGVHVVDERTFLVGTPKGIRAVLSKPAKNGGRQQSAPGPVAEKPLFQMTVHPGPLVFLGLKADSKFKDLVPLLNARSWLVNAEAGKELCLTLRAEFPDEAAAKKGKEAVVAVVKQVNDYLAVSEAALPTFFQREAPKHPNIKELSDRLAIVLKATGDELKAFRAEQKGSVVEGALHIKTDEPTTAFVLLLSMLPRAPKKPGE